MKPILLVACILIACWGCTKGGNTYVPLASLNVINAMVDHDTPLVVVFDNQGYYSNAASIGFGEGMELSLAAGYNPIVVASSADTSHPLIIGTLNVSASMIYSLFLTGLSTHPDTMLVVDRVPLYVDSDSVTGVRFVNCSPGSRGFTVNLQGADTVLVTGLVYRQASTFLSLPAISRKTSYVFEFRDAASGKLQVSYTMSNAPGRSQTMVISGQEGVGAPLKVFAYNDF